MSAPHDVPTAQLARQLESLLELWKVAQRDHGGSHVAVQFLLGLYNGSRFPFDLTELRRLDAVYMTHALNVLALDWRPSVEVHVHLQRLTGLRAMGERFELLACEWRMKGRCTKEGERHCREQVAKADEVVAGLRV